MREKKGLLEAQSRYLDPTVWEDNNGKRERGRMEDKKGRK